MVLFKGEDKDSNKKPNSSECDPYMFMGQGFFQTIFVLVAVLCIPWMLFAKPYMMIQERKRQHLQVLIVNALLIIRIIYL